MTDDSAAFSVLFMELVLKILSKGDSPAEFSEYLAESLRAIIGARTVMVFQRAAFSDAAGANGHELLSVYPERRRSLGGHEAVLEIAALSETLDSTAVFLPTDDGPIPEALKRMGMGPTLVTPLRYMDKRMGLLLILDLMDAGNRDTLLASLDRLSAVLALVLRNAYLYRHLEREVALRTRELEQRGEALAKALREKEIMLKEVHHRVKNNLQIVNSLLYLQTVNANDPVIREALGKGQNRIQSMALVHDELYRSDDLSSVDMSAYAKRLCSGFDSSPDARVSVRCEARAIKLPVTLSVPCGLILNGLITNAIKHAYPARRGEVRVSIRRRGEEIAMAVEDDGVGLGPEAASPDFGSLGMSLVRGLVDQLHGTLSVADGPMLGGARVSVAFVPSDAESGARGPRKG